MHKTRLKQVTANQLYSLTMSTGREPVLLLGAGASVTSGVPLAGGHGNAGPEMGNGDAEGMEPEGPQN